MQSKTSSVDYQYLRDEEILGLNVIFPHYPTGADMTIINTKGQEPIHLAVMRNHSDIVKYMFEKSVNLESQCFQGRQPLHYAAQFGGKYSLDI